MIPILPAKSADEVLDYKLDMSAELAARNTNGTNDTLSSVSWVVRTIRATSSGADLNIYASSNDASSATVWLSAGTTGTVYEVAAEMITTGGRTYQRSFVITVEDR